MSAAVVLGAGAAFAQTLTVEPDQIDKGTSRTVTLTLSADEKSVPPNVTVFFAGQAVEGTKTNGAKITAKAPALEIVGPAPVVVRDKADKLLASGQVLYVDRAPSPRVLSRGGIIAASILILLIVALPWGIAYYDVKKGYRAQEQGREKLLLQLPGPVTTEQLKILLPELQRNPPSMDGLTRGSLALTLLLILGIALFYILVVDSDVPERVEKLLTLLVGAFTSISGFYFGARSVETGREPQAAPPPPAAPESQSTSFVPTIKDRPNPPKGPKGTVVTLKGAFGKGEGTVLFGDKKASVVSWGEETISVHVPDDLPPQTAQIVVKAANGQSSKPVEFTVETS